MVQEYITRPLLFGGRKFDIRAVACLTHDRRVLWYPDYILRLCSEPHSLDDLGERVVSRVSANSVPSIKLKACSPLARLCREPVRVDQQPLHTGFQPVLR